MGIYYPGCKKIVPPPVFYFYEYLVRFFLDNIIANNFFHKHLSRRDRRVFEILGWDDRSHCEFQYEKCTHYVLVSRDSIFLDICEIEVAWKARPRRRFLITLKRNVIGRHKMEAFQRNASTKVFFVRNCFQRSILLSDIL